MIYPGLLLWAAGDIRVGRYLVALLPLLSVLAVVSLRPLFERGLTSFGVVAVASLSLLAQLEAPVNPRRLLEPGSLAGLPEQASTRELWERIHRELPSDAKLFLFFANRVLFLEREVMVDPVLEAPTGLALLRRTGSPDAMAELLRDQGITHLVANTWWERRYFQTHDGPAAADRPREEREYAQFFRRHARLLFQHGVFNVFELLPVARGTPETSASPG